MTLNIPDVAVHEGAKLICGSPHKPCAACVRRFRAALNAALSAWPGMVQDHGYYFTEADDAIVLPLPPPPAGEPE